VAFFLGRPVTKGRNTRAYVTDENRIPATVVILSEKCQRWAEIRKYRRFKVPNDRISRKSIVQTRAERGGEDG